MSNIEHSSTHHYWIRNRDLTCVTTSSKPNNDGIWEIVSEISWTVWVPRSWTATVYDFLDKQSAACGWSPIVLHHPQEIWSRNSIPTSRNFSGHTKEVYVCTLTVKRKKSWNQFDGQNNFRYLILHGGASNWNEMKCNLKNSWFSRGN